MRLDYHRRRVASFGAALKQSKAFTALTSGCRVRRSSMRRRGGAPRAVADPRARALGVLPRAHLGRPRSRSTAVPVLEKAEMMERFDGARDGPAGCAATSCSRGSGRAAATSSSRAATG